jgi:type III pantothenate kinase
MPYERMRKAASTLARRAPEAIVYASVVPSREREFERRTGGRSLKLGRDLPVPVRVRSGGAWRPGVDRLCNALAAFALFGRPCVCVDVGSALNIEVISGRGDLVAGAIAPGPGLMLESLRACEALPRVDGGSRRLGRTTIGNIRAGVGLAVAGLVREAIALARAKLGRPPRVVATGGGASLLRGAGLAHRFDPHLTLRGAMLAYRRWKR